MIQFKTVFPGSRKIIQGLGHRHLGFISTADGHLSITKCSLEAPKHHWDGPSSSWYQRAQQHLKSIIFSVPGTEPLLTTYPGSAPCSPEHCLPPQSPKANYTDISQQLLNFQCNHHMITVQTKLYKCKITAATNTMTC